MSAIALTTAGRVEVMESESQKTLQAGVAITAGQAIYPVVTTGRWGLAAATAATNCSNVHLATKSAAIGEGLTGIKRGKMDGYAISALNFGDQVFLSDTPGGLDTAAGTVSVVLGRVQPSTAQPLGTNPDHTLVVNCPT